jgi:hypothetical protein
LTAIAPARAGASLGDTLRSLAPCLRGDLIAADGLRRIVTTVERLPAALSGSFGFESRLGVRAAAADFSCCVTRLHGGAAVLAGRSGAHQLPQAWREHPVWHRLGRFCQEWIDPTSALHAGVRELWLEFDVGDHPPGGIPLPSVFLGTSADAAAHGCLLERAMPLLLGARLPPAIEHTLRVCAEALPSGAWVRHVGVMLARGPDVLRLEVKDLSLDSLPALLDRIGWSGAGGEAAAALSAFARRAATPRLMLGLDVGLRVGPRVGLQCFAPPGPGGSPGWAAFLDYLVAQGLCVPAKRAALLAWCGYAHEADGDAASPEQLAPLSALVGLPARGVFVPWVSHVKVSYEPDRPLEAKAYVGIDLRWRLR